MAQIRPFRAYRPCQGMEKRIAALPYDVYNRAEACEVVKKNPESFLAVDRAETSGISVSFSHRAWSRAAISPASRAGFFTLWRM